MIQAVDIVRGPLQRFYDLLSDEQRQRFNAMGNSGGGQAPAGGNVVALCSEQSSDVTKVPVQRIEQVLQPSGQQQEAFDALKKASQDAAAQLQGSCPSEMPQTPVRAPRCGQDAACRHGGGHEHHPPEAARLLRLAE